MGIAVGRVGMSRSDFERCTPLEFTKIVQAANDKTEATIRAGWEQTRIQVVSVLNLFSKKTIDMKRAFPLPWDNWNETAAEVQKGTSSVERMREIEMRVKNNHSSPDNSPS